MSESKTPRTDEQEFCMIGLEGKPIPPYAVSSSVCRQLEAENAELKAKVEELKRDLDRVFPERDELKAENIRITKLRDHDFEELAELAELKRQIAEGELIPLEVYIWWTEEEGMNIPVIGGMSLQEFAKREAGAK